MDLPGYDDWKTTPPEDDGCEFCGANLRNDGWQPHDCDGRCGIRWRDPDAEYEAKRDEPPLPADRWDD